MEIKTVRKAARDEFVWPGGYRLWLLMADGECICPKCARREWRQVSRATKAPLSDWPDKNWRVEGVFVNWEGESITCAHCNEEHDSEYGEVE